jgi:predicted nucleic acid-binding protein/predicted DNA-binding antitoxin AbrB/MazE fold protein
VRNAAHGGECHEDETMTIDVDATYENGVLKLDRPVQIADNTRVHVIIETPGTLKSDDDDPTGWKTADELIGFIKDGPKGPVGRDHDKYLYGAEWSSSIPASCTLFSTLKTKTIYESEAFSRVTVGDLCMSYSWRTPQVIFETITLIRVAQREGRPDSKSRHKNAVYAGERLFAGKLARIHRPSEEEEREAFDYFKRYDDQEYSFVDCLSFVVMERLGIREAWAVDSDFTHRFIARPGPS